MTNFVLQFYDFNVWANKQFFMRLKGLPKDAEQLKEQTESKGLEEMETMFLELSERYKSFLNPKENINKYLIIENPSGDLMKTVCPK